MGAARCGECRSCAVRGVRELRGARARARGGGRVLQPLHCTQNGLTGRPFLIGNCLYAHDCCAILDHTDLFGALPALGEK